MNSEGSIKDIRNFCCVIDQRSGRPACPLQNVEINAVVGSMISEVTIVQNYTNMRRGNIEAFYTFPLPHNAQVTDFKGKIGENEVRGEFRKKEEAFAEYAKAVRTGDSAFLIESHRPDIFQISLGNIAPGEKISIAITYLEDMRIIDNELRWILPTVIAPRYIIGSKFGNNSGMGTMMPADRVSDADYITSHLGETAYTLRIRAVLSGLKGIKKVSSPSHPVEVLLNGDDVIVSLAKETELLDSDFILSVFLDMDAESSYVTAVSRNIAESGTTGRYAEASDLSSHVADTFDTAGHDIVGHGTVSHDTVGCDTVSYDTAGHDTVNYDTASHDTVSYDTAGHNIVRLDTASHNIVRLDTASQAVESFGMARLIMELDDYRKTQNHYEYTFMIDVSGSMSGEKLEQAKRALIISLRNLLEGDYFNIVAFESNFSCFSKDAVPYSQKNLEKADRWIAALREMGGTEILEPLRFVLEDTTSNHNLERIVLLFTDGQVGNEKDIMMLVKEHNQSLQFFPFGIDTAVNKFFIDSLAAAGNGIPEYIYPGERIEDKVIRQFSRINQTYLANPVVSGYDGTELETIPPLPARIYSSEVYSFMVRSEKTDVLEEIKICGRIEEKNTEIILRPNATGDARLLGLKWAKGKIELLEEQAGSKNQRKNALLKQEILELSIRYSLLSSMTSLVAVHKRMVKETGIPETIVVPVSKPRGWDMFDDTLDMMYYMAPSVVTEASMRSYTDESTTNELNIPIFFRKNITNRSCNARAETKGRLSNTKKDTTPSINEIIRKVAQSQNADGTFGSGSEVNRRTSFYIIGMLLLIKEWRPYRIQITKAGGALIRSDSNDLLLKAAALLLLQEQRLIQAEEFKADGNKTEENKAGELRTVTDGITSKLSEHEAVAYEAFKSRDLKPLCNIIGYKFTGNIDKHELAPWFLVNAIEHK